MTKRELGNEGKNLCASVVFLPSKKFQNLHYVNDSEELCGLSLYLPENEQEISHYSSLALYQGVVLVSLYRGIVAS
jgi:hypothetical protein